MLRTPAHWDLHSDPPEDQPADQIADYRPDAGNWMTDDQYERWTTGK